MTKVVEVIDPCSCTQCPPPHCAWLCHPPGIPAGPTWHCDGVTGQSLTLGALWSGTLYIRARWLHRTMFCKKLVSAVGGAASIPNPGHLYCDSSFGLCR